MGSCERRVGDGVLPNADRALPPESLLAANEDALVRRFAGGSENGVDTLEGENARPLRRGRARLHAGDVVGRHVIVGSLGIGGMGEVHAAFDPKLDRKVAIKVLHPRLEAKDGTTGHRRLLREAKAAAKLDHPNVVTVYDVGEHEGRVFIAMELVEGQTLAEWLLQDKPRWRDVVRVFVDAGQGLAAAHARGLVHRDFKPQNVMVDVRGRARVMDFGLARSTGSTPSVEATGPHGDTPPTTADATLGDSVAGTPAYMAPEQFAGLGAGPAADQFSFCVSLWEALYRQLPFEGDSLIDLAMRVLEAAPRPPRSSGVPRWLHRICLRGLTPEPQQRFGSMDELVHALQRGRARATGRRVAVALASVALAAAGVVAKRSYDAAELIATCESRGHDEATLWTDTQRQALREALQNTRKAHAAVTADKVMPWLDEHAVAWTHARVGACRNLHIEQTWDADTHDRSLWCLEERKGEFDALLSTLTAGGADVVDRAVPAAAALQRVEPCIDEDWLSRSPTPPADGRESVRAIREKILEARIALRTSGRDAMELTGEAVAEAEAYGWAPLAAAARLLHGHSLSRAGAYDEAEAAFEDAFFEAADSESPALAFDAAHGVLTVAGLQLERYDDGLRWARFAQSQLRVLPDRGNLRLADQLHQLARLHAARGAFDEAAERAERALTLREAVLPPRHPSLAKTLDVLAQIRLAQGSFDTARVLLQRALAIREEALGPEHPDVAILLVSIGNVFADQGRLDEALGRHLRALEIWEDAFGEEHPVTAKMLGNLGIVHMQLEQPEQAEALFERTLSIQKRLLGPDHVDTWNTVDNLAVAQLTLGRPENAVPSLEGVLEFRRGKLGPDHPHVATALDHLAEALVGTGDVPRAERVLREAVKVREKAFGSTHPQLARTLSELARLVMQDGRAEEAVDLATRALEVAETTQARPGIVAKARFELARALWEVGRERPRAVELAQQARVLEGAPKTALDAWLETHAPKPERRGRP